MKRKKSARSTNTRPRTRKRPDDYEDFSQIVKSKRQWLSTIDAITDYVFVVNAASELKRANMSFSDQFKKHPREIIGSKITELLKEEMSEACAVVERALVSKLPVSEEVRTRNDAYMISIFPAMYDEGEVFVCVMKNITEMKKLRDQLYHSYKLASIGRLVSGIAHEINNPLTGILGFSELLFMRVEDKGVKAELEKILKAAERCKGIVEGLLCFSCQQPPQKSLVNLNEVLEKTLELRSYWHKSNDAEIVKQYGRLPAVYVDIQQIQQAVLSILMNSEQAISDSGRKGRIGISTAYDGVLKSVEITLWDNGSGIPRKYLDRVFDPFFSTKPVNQGTGLGLSISYGIIKEHGGTISVRSVEGEGTTFLISLPVANTIGG